MYARQPHEQATGTMTALMPQVANLATLGAGSTEQHHITIRRLPPGSLAPSARDRSWRGGVGAWWDVQGFARMWWRGAAAPRCAPHF